MKRSYVQIDGILYEKGSEPRVDAPLIMPDIGEYTSMIDGTRITSRSQHRAHLKKHGCVELGNEPLKWAEQGPQGIPDVDPAGRKELIRSQIDAMSYREFKAAIKRDVDRVKWNSRER